MREERGRRVAVAAAAALFFLLSSGCGLEYLQPPIDVLIDRRGVAVQAKVSPERDEDMAVAFDAYFPSQVQVKPGDEIIFEPGYTGEPHTVALGTLVDEAVAQVEGLPSGAPLEEVEALPSMQAVPTFFPRAVAGESAPINASAAEPCFLDSGTPPTAPAGGSPACPDRAQPEFDGTQAFYSSGWIPEDERFRMTFSEDIEPGTYTFMCLVHRSAMTGTVEVVGEDRNVPSKAEVTNAGEDKLDRLRSGLDALADQVVEATTDEAVAGAGEPWTGEGQITTFFPERAEIDVGEAIRWRVSGMHTITLQPDVTPGELLEETDEGIVLDPDVVTPSEGAPRVPPASLVYPPPAGGEPLEVSASWDGEGTFNSGLLWSIPPVEVLYRVAFSEPGTYELRCLVHPDMRGVVEVAG